MRRQNAFTKSSGRIPRHRVLGSVIGGVAACCSAIGGWMLWLHAQSSEPQMYRAPAGVLLVLMGLMQLRLAYEAWHGRVRTADFALHLRFIFWRWLFAGTAVCYITGLLLGPSPDVGYFFCAALAGWYTLVLWLVIWRPGVLFYTSSRFPWRVASRLGHAALLLLFVVAAAEGLLRLYANVSDDHLPAAFVAKTHTLPPGAEFRGRQVNKLGYWGDDFHIEPRPGCYRIAVLGDALVLSGNDETNFLSRLQCAMPGVEVYNFGIPEAGPREYAAQLGREVASFQPDLVLTFVAVGNDITQQIPLPGPFDWRSLNLYQFGALSSGTMLCVANPPLLVSSDPVSREAYLHNVSGQLAVCRTPIDESVYHRWGEANGYLSDIVRICRNRDIATALVVAPSEVQVDGQLRESVCRRSGYQSCQIDVELPQRRLAAFANEQKVPMLDLLPHFRAADQTPYCRNRNDWNDAGNVLVADVLSGWLARHFAMTAGSGQQAALPK